MAPLRERLGSVGVWVPGFATGGLAGAGDLAVRVERLGIRALWVGGGNRDAGALDERAAMLAATEQLVVATGIVNIWAWDPVALHAKAVAIEEAHPGRFVLGLGVSHRPQVEQLGRNYQRPLSAMRTFLEALDALDAGDRPAAPPRVLAALGPKMLKLARDRTAGAHPYLGTPDHTATARRVLGPGPVLAPEQAVVVSGELDEARRIAREYLATYLALPNYATNLRRLGFEDQDFEGGGSDRLVDGLVPSGDAEAVAARVQEHFDAGADHVCVQPMGEARTVDLKGLEALAGALGQS
jgi:probable F420-dependent oxidoreductase